MPNLGLLKRKEVWIPTVWGWALLLLAFGGLLVGVLVATVPFLAPVRPIGHGTLVVEGWLPDYALEQAKRVFDSRNYRVLVVTGIPIDQGFFIAKETNYAYLAATTLRGFGVKPDLIVPVTCPDIPRNRTYATARRVRRWLQTQPSPEPVDVLTLGVHARRTWLLYRMALGEKYPTGIIAAADNRYDSRRWWTSSSGVRTVTSEIIAYLYAKLLFFPGGPEARENDVK